MLRLVEIVVGGLLFAGGLARDVVAGDGAAELGLKQSLVVLAGLVLAADGAWRLRRSRRGLFESLGERSRAGVLGTGLLAAALLALGVHAFRDYAVDDSWITYRYARTLLETGRVAWNPGGEAVEGYSNFLWMLLAAGALALRLEPLQVSRAVSVVCLVAAALLVHRLARRQCRGVAAPRVAALAFLCLPSLAFWGMSGLETASVVALVLLWLLAYQRDFDAERPPWRTALVGLALVLSRPEAPALVGLTLLPSLLSRRPGERRRALWLAAAVALLAAPYAAWKLVHFGTLVPNTLTAKVRTLVGLPLVFQSYRFVFPLLPLAALSLLRGGGRLERQVWSLWLGLTLAAVNIQPHVAHYLRFFLPAFGGIAVLLGLYGEQLARALREASPRLAAPAGAVLAAALAVYLVSPVFEMQTYARREAEGYARAHVPVGLALAATFGRDELLAASDCGLVPYLANMRTVDLWGLTDRHLARRGFDAAYVMRQRPVAVVVHSLYPNQFVGRELYDRVLQRAVLEDPELALRGRWPFFGYWLWVYARRPLEPAPLSRVSASR